MDKKKEVRMFLASSIDDLKDDRVEIGNFIRMMDKIYSHHGVKIILNMCEDEVSAISKTRKQEEYNQQIRDSQLCFVLFFNKAGERTVEEFHVAHESYLAKDYPRTVVCFKKGQGYAPDQTMLAFREYLEKELGCDYEVYEQIDSLKLKLCIMLMNLDVPVRVGDGKVLVGEEEALSLDNIAAFSQNDDIMRLKAEYEVCEQEFQAAKACYLEHRESDTTFFEIAERRRKAKEAYEELEKQVFSLLVNKAKATGEPMTARQREAYALVEQGKLKEASAMLNTDDILADASHTEKLAEQVKSDLSQRVAELLQKVNIEKAMVGDPERFDRIAEIYEVAVAMEEKHALPKTALREYCDYLLDQKDYGKAGQLAERNKSYMQLGDQQYELADACNMLGLIYSDNAEMMEEAFSEYRQACEIIEELAAEDPEKYLPDVAATHMNIAGLYKKKGDYNNALDECLQAKVIYEELDKRIPGKHLNDLATACNNLGILYSDMNQNEKAESEYLEAWRILDSIADGGKSVAFSDIAMLYTNLGLLYNMLGKRDKAERLLKDAKLLYERLAMENPQAYLPDLASSCNNLSNLYTDLGRVSEAEAEYRLAYNIRVELTMNNPAVYLPGIAETCHNLGILYQNARRMDEAEAAFLQAKEIRESLVEMNIEYYLYDLAFTCRSLGELYKDLGRKQEAETELTHAKHIFAERSVSQPERCLLRLSDTCNCLGVLYQETGETEKAESEFREEQDAQERLMKLSKRTHSKGPD